MRLNHAQEVAQLKKREKKLLEKKRQLLQQKKRRLYQPHEKQALFHQHGATCAERLFLAGNRCGKTYSAAMEMAYHLTGDYPNWWQGKCFNGPIKAWAASLTSEATRDILQRAYLGDAVSHVGGTLAPHEVLSTTLKRGVSGAVDTVYVRHVSGEISSLGFKSYDQGREKFQGTSRHFIHLDEEPEMAIYNECLMRTLDVQGSVMLTMTPLKGMSELCEHFLQASDDENNAAGRIVVNATWQDAPHLSDVEKVRLRASLSPHEIEAREKGVPALGTGKVYPVSEQEIRTPRFVLPTHFKRVFGIDFGWSNPTAVVWAAYDAENDVMYIYDVYSACEKTPAQHAKVIETKGGWIPGVCDPAGQSASQSDGVSLVEKYADHGVYLTQANNGVEAGLMHMLERMQTGRLKVFDDLESWWREFRLYRRDEKGRIVKRNDHLMDATRYVAMSGLPLAKAVGVKPLRREVNSWRTV